VEKILLPNLLMDMTVKSLDLAKNFYYLRVYFFVIGLWFS
jgi:hypothetical protein